jgi:hypothetical protein
MAVIVELKGRLNPLVIGGSMERFVHELNLQASQGKQFIMMQKPDDTPIAFNQREVLTVEPQDPESAFFGDTVTGGS